MQSVPTDILDMNISLMNFGFEEFSLGTIFDAIFFSPYALKPFQVSDRPESKYLSAKICD
jgi:hypothetical protein